VPRGQSWDPARFAKNARFVSDLGMPVVKRLAPQPGERVIDGVRRALKPGARFIAECGGKGNVAGWLETFIPGHLDALLAGVSAGN